LNKYLKYGLIIIGILAVLYAIYAVILTMSWS
jgi:hypothetical protein